MFKIEFSEEFSHGFHNGSRWISRWELRSDEDREYSLVIGNWNSQYEVILTYLTFGTSVLSGALGIAKFMKVGPFRLVPMEKFCGGFLLLVSNMAISIVLKAASIAFIMVYYNGESDQNQSINKLVNGILYWILFNLTPQLLLVSINYIHFTDQKLSRFSV